MKLSLIPILLLIAVGMFSAQVSAITINPTVEIVGNVPNRVAIYDIEIDATGIYVAYREALGSPFEIYFTKSTDNGATWSSPVLISTTTHTNAGKLFLRDNGDIGLAWVDIPTTEHQLYFSKSTDGGVTWGTPTTSANDFNGFDFSWAYDGDVLFFGFSDGNLGEYQGGITSTDFGATWNPTTVLQGEKGGCVTCQYSTFEQANSVVHGNNIYSSFFTTDNFSFQVHTWFVKSNDAGATWDTPIQLSSTEIDNFIPYVVVNEDGGKVVVQWLDAGGTGGLYYTVSTNGGNTFGTPVEIEDFGTCYDSWVLSGENEDLLFACDDQSGLGRHYKLSSDFGTSFSSYSLLNGTSAMSPTNFPLMQWTGDNIYDVLTDGTDINQPNYIFYSDDRGATFNYDLIPDMNATSIDPSTPRYFEVFDDIFAFLFESQTTNPFDTLNIFIANLPNSGTTPPDTTAPVISTIETEPITILENSVFDFTDHVVCLDDVDGDITLTMDVTGTINTAMRGTQSQTYVCEDSALNGVQKTIEYIIKKKSTTYGGTGGSGVTSSIGGQQQNTVQSLADVPILSFAGDSSASPATVGTTGKSFLDSLYSSFFADSPAKQKVEEAIESQSEVLTVKLGEKAVEALSSISSSSAGTVDSGLGGIGDFISNLFGGFFR